MSEDSKILQEEFAPVLAALREHRDEIAGLPGLAAARPGYTLSGDTKIPALVLAFHPPRPALDLDSLRAKLGADVRAVNASPDEQIIGAARPSFVSAMRRLLEPVEAPGFGPPRRGNYRPPEGPGAPTLDPVEEEMTVTVCASPDAGWPVLRNFLAEKPSERLAVALYDFSAEHVRDALLAALDGTSATLLLVLDPRSAKGGVGGTGINGADAPEADVRRALRKALGDRLELVRAPLDAVATDYHIKVAVADGERVWLSSGNWQSSNLPPWDFKVSGDKPPFPLARYNRDYHAVVHSPTLARCFEGFIEHDATLGNAFAGPVDDGPRPMLLVPDEMLEPEDFAPSPPIPPVTVTGRIKVTPLLTPDNFPRFVLQQLRRARHRVWIQNQYIKPKADGDNFQEMDLLLKTLGRLANDPEIDLRLCLRGVDDQHKDRLLAAGVKPSQIRVQRNCHAKLWVIDDKRAIVGSQNLSNEGFVANRDASLAFENAEIAAFFARVFERDWDNARPLADADSFTIRVDTGGPVPQGLQRVPWNEVFDTPPPAAPGGTPGGAAPVVASGPPSATSPGGVDDLPFFGVDETGRRLVESSARVAANVRAGISGPDPIEERLGRMIRTPSFGLPPGTSAEALDTVGWGVVWGPSISQDVKDALRPLLEHRRAEVGDPSLFHELTYKPGHSLRDFLAEHGGEVGSVRVESVPYYLLLVGDPREIPFSFQTLLDVEYRVGRLDLATPKEFAQYAASVVKAETGVFAPRERVLHAFGPSHEGDTPTGLSVDVLVRAAERWLDAFPLLKKKHGFSARIDAGDVATKARLLDVLRGAAGRPELLFTAGHGMACRPSSPRQGAEQGALVTADWDGFSDIDASALVRAADVPEDADLGGLVAFLFACFGVGTPATDSFPTHAGQVLAKQPFVSALPRALLSHPKGGALGVFGHIDRTLTWSLQPPGQGVTTAAFQRAAASILAGQRLGAALDDLNGRGATFAAEVAESLRPGAPPMEDAALVRTWIQQRDAAAYVLLGDPAARVRR